MFVDGKTELAQLDLAERSYKPPALVGVGTKYKQGGSSFPPCLVNSCLLQDRCDASTE